MSYVDNDVDSALRLVKLKEYEPFKIYSRTSPIYKGTNEVISCPLYSEALKKNDKVLSVIGSGDQILNTIMFDSYNIDAFDISNFPKYYLKLKIACIKNLSYEEYLEFFYGEDYFKKELFDKVVKTMDYNSKFFWSRMCSNRTPREVYSSHLFSIWHPEKNDAISMNPFLKKDNYYKLRDNLNKTRIRYYDENIYSLVDKIDTSYDLINLSNIGAYCDNNFFGKRRIDSCYKFGEFVKNLKITTNGKVLNYLIDAYDSTSSIIYDTIVYNDEGFTNTYVDNDSTGRIDAVSVYRKVR